jgi:predicted transcriptional regulator
MLLPHIEKFLRETGMPWTKFGRLAAHDPRFVADLRNGRTPRPRTMARIVRFMSAYRESHHA